MFNYDTKYKLVILGDQNVGKSTYFNKLARDEHYIPSTTIGVDFATINKEINGKKVKICIWDTAGQEAFESIVRIYFKEIAAAIIMFDVSNSKSLENIKKWQKLLKYENKCNHNHPILLIGNKNDQLIKYNKKVLEEILHDKNITYDELSCKTINRLHLEEKILELIKKTKQSNNCLGIKHYSEEEKVVVKKSKKWKDTCCIIN